MAFHGSIASPFIPTSNAALDLGSSSFRFDDVFSQNTNSLGFTSLGTTPSKARLSTEAVVNTTSGNGLNVYYHEWSKFNQMTATVLANSTASGTTLYADCTLGQLNGAMLEINFQENSDTNGTAQSIYNYFWMLKTEGTNLRVNSRVAGREYNNGGTERISSHTATLLSSNIIRVAFTVAVSRDFRVWYNFHGGGVHDLTISKA